MSTADPTVSTALSYGSNNTLPVEVLTDACHGWSKNATQTGVICLGNKSKKVKSFSLVTAVDDACPRRHETVGAKRIYTAFEQRSSKTQI